MRWRLVLTTGGRGLRALPPMLALLAVAGCSKLAPGSPLAEARRSPEALADAALAATRAEDDDALAGLMVTRNEYERLLWPSLPDREQVPFEFVWSVTGPRSRKARHEHLSEYGGMRLELVRVDLGTEIEPYDDFTLYLSARMFVRNPDTGEEGQLALMDALVEMDGGWKFLNFRENL